MLINESLTCTLAAQTTNHILDVIKGNLARRERKVVLLLYSALARAHLEYCIQLCRPSIGRMWTCWSSPEEVHQDHCRAGAPVL